jgi:hypothetical protein
MRFVEKKGRLSSDSLPRCNTAERVIGQDRSRDGDLNLGQSRSGLGSGSVLGFFLPWEDRYTGEEKVGVVESC